MNDVTAMGTKKSRLWQDLSNGRDRKGAKEIIMAIEDVGVMGIGMNRNDFAQWNMEALALGLDGKG